MTIARTARTARTARFAAISRLKWSAVARPWRRQGTVTCASVAAELPRILDEGVPATALVVSHVQACLSCQAELARYRRLVRLLHQLRSSEIDPPPSVIADVLSVVEAMASRRVIWSVLTGRRLAYAGAALAAGGAAAGLVALARSHGRHVVASGAGAIVMTPGMIGARPTGLERPRGGQ
jgi:anti-sigma factor RsiW